MMFLEELHDSPDHFPMFLQCLCEYKDVVEVYHHYSFGNQILEDSVHHCLESSWTISQTKEHDEWLIEASVSPESGFTLISVLHSNIIKTPADIELSEVPGPL